MAGLSGVISIVLINLFFFVPASLSLPSPGNVGCLFSDSVCDPEQEICKDDGVFGRCKQIFELDSDASPYRYELGEEELARLTEEMEALFAQGYRWQHPRTQCILQSLLSTFISGREFDQVFCDTLKDRQPRLRDQESPDQDENSVKDVAYIRYMPSELDPNPEFADEVYSPPGISKDNKETEAENKEEEYLSKLEKRAEVPVLFSKIYNTPDQFRNGFESKDQPIALPILLEEPKLERRLDNEGIFRRHYSSPQAFREASNRPDEEDEGRVLGVIRRSPPPLDDSLDFDTDLSDPEIDLGLGTGFDESDLMSDKKTLDDESGFSEGGLILAPNRNDEVSRLVSETSDLSDLLDEMDEWSFRRSERLDVKKPGPQFSTNNYAFQDTSTKKDRDSAKIVTKPSSKPPVREGQKETMPSELPNHPPKARVQSRTLWFQSILGDPHKKGVKSSHYSHHSAVPYSSPSKNSVLDNDQYDVVDTSFTYIEFKDSIKTWSEGVHIVKTVANLLQIPQEMFTQPRMDRNEVTFKVVEPNPMGWNASEVARRIDAMKDHLKKEIGVTVTSVGVGDKNKLPTAVKLIEREEQAYVVIVMVCGVLAALGLSAGVLYLTRRHGNKLANMTSSDTEPSKHYQDLCRARMSSKNGESGAAVPPNRVASLSRESDNSPSSRSSTSSWSEEPVLSNMDVATGQMVLSYMEDHLKNKERLETEWTALCAYKADPCATSIAEQEENKVKNRDETGLPYDHARVVLNELSNITGSDYINASTITDHDPRNPAYIVTQGPLSTTAPDFWQMVWEQGCVVIVMLTRLVENDNAMCHRYWPAEGSELYHIFEVHLVSEHIWCDDYLVRSFYLKNMKTGETRTVTQFHFLSWPEASIPQLTKPLLEFRRKVNKSFRGRSCPIVVHCSDGVGRSGTYCLLDMVLNRMAKGAKEIDVAATLEHIRDQRAGALATAQQFRFVLSSVADELHAILRLHPQASQ